MPAFAPLVIMRPAVAPSFACLISAAFFFVRPWSTLTLYVLI
jgi:hypothetical protein